MSRAAADAGWALDEIDALIAACGVMEQPIPGTAPLVQRRLGLGASGIPAIDINATCLSFLPALDHALAGVALGRWRRVLIVSADIASAALDHGDLESSAIFAERRHRLDLRSDSPPAERPVNDYARTKLAAERRVREEQRLQTLVLRPSAVIGPHDRAILPRLLRVLSRGFLPLGNGGAALFHPTDVRDAATAFAAAALGTATGVANIAGAEPVRILDMARALAVRLEGEVRFPILPEPVLDALAGAAECHGRISGREPPITRYSAAIPSWSRTFDLSGTEALLGWRPAHGPADALAHAVPA